jgi:hypothetical protein
MMKSETWFGKHGRTLEAVEGMASVLEELFLPLARWLVLAWLNCTGIRFEVGSAVGKGALETAFAISTTDFQTGTSRLLSDFSRSAFDLSLSPSITSFQRSSR